MGVGGKPPWGERTGPDEGRHDAAHAFRNGMIEGRQALIMVRRFGVADAIFAFGFAL